MTEQQELFPEIALPKPKRAGRGLGKRPALVCTSIRLPKHVMEYFDAQYPTSKQVKMREILTAYIADNVAQREVSVGCDS